MAHAAEETASENNAQKALEDIAKCFPVLCKCGVQMTIRHTMSSYHSSVAWCDGCKKNMGKQEYSFHCPIRSASAVHSSGFDYCFDCGVKQYHTQRDDIFNDELDIIYNTKYKNINNQNINKLMNELCELQSKELKIIQSLNSRLSRNESEEKKNDKMELTQTQIYQNLNALQQMVNTQKTIIPITLHLLETHKKIILNWREWNVEDVIHWMINVHNGIFKQYTTELTQGCTKENVKGKSLKYVDDSCLLRWAVYDIEMRNKLLSSITALIKSKDNETETEMAGLMETFGQEEGK